MPQLPSNFSSKPVTGGLNDNFVGIRASGNEITLYYPDAYSFDAKSDDAKKQIIYLIKSLKLAKTHNWLESNLYSERENKSEFALNSYLWIVKDYLLHGFYVNTEKTYAHGYSGKINWKRTLQTQPLISKNKNVIYLDTISEVKKPEDNILVEIHRSCVKISIDFIGWIFGYSSKNIHVPKFTPGRKRLYISVLRSELDAAFNDEKKELLTRMLDVIKGLDDKSANTSDFSYGIDNYYYVFERMVDEVFGGIEDISKFYPQGKWEIFKPNERSFDSSDLRPDTILIDDQKKVAYILDAKFYRFGVEEFNKDNLPGTTSIQKQITYGDYLKRQRPDFKVYNAFILPYNKLKGPYSSSDDLQLIGRAYADWKSNEESHDYIYAFLIDFKHLLYSWCEHQRTDDSLKLMNDIEDIVNKTSRGENESTRLSS